MLPEPRQTNLQTPNSVVRGSATTELTCLCFVKPPETQAEAQRATAGGVGRFLTHFIAVHARNWGWEKAMGQYALCRIIPGDGLAASLLADS